MRHTVIATLDPLLPLVDPDFADTARAIAATHTDDADDYLYLRGCAHPGRYPFLHALVADRRTRRIEVMSVRETRGPGPATTWLECIPLPIKAVRKEFADVHLDSEFDALLPHLTEGLANEIAADAGVIADALAAVERALSRASTGVGAELLRRAAAPLRI